ncbi:MAG: hypothetical protein INH41_02305 [Myxococcaceae bacterium]|nr:hypothetical protein [Myxococcaceae bacterium]MCA3011212.1 hypothetical protein [Myxococcaceae bacterium]
MHSRLVGILWAVAACGPGVPSVADPGPPVGLVRAEVVSPGPLGLPPAGLRAALVWAALSPEVEACLGDARTAEDVVACAGSRFRPSLSSESVPVTPAFPAALTIPLAGPPPLTALGPSRFGYALVVAFSDTNANDALDLVPPEAIDGPDRVLGSSLRPGSDLSGTYLAWREGDVPPAWNAFRWLAGCPEPPRGYFLVGLDQDGNRVRCRLETLASTLTLSLDDSRRTRARACMHATTPLPAPPPEAPPPAQARVLCWGPRSAEVVLEPMATCERALRYDVGDRVPGWWPCRTAAVTLELARAGEPLTPSRDRLFTLRFIDGPGAFRLGDLRVRVGDVTLSTLDSTLIVGQQTFTLGDRDGDGLFSRGDTLTVDEDEPGRFTSAPVGALAVDVWAESDARVVPLGTTLRWTP